MITVVLVVVASVALLTILIVVTMWAIQREPAGHGQHAMRRDRERLSLARLWRTSLTWLHARAERQRDGLGLSGLVTLTYDDLPYCQPGSYASVEEVHHGRPGRPNLAQRNWQQRPPSVVRDGLAPWVTPVTVSITINVIVEPSPALKADLARIDAEALAVITRIDAEYAAARDALHAWSGQLELTGATA